MRILQLHSDFIEYEPIEKEIIAAEEAERKRVRLEEIVVLFVTIEDGDTEAIAREAVEEIKSSLLKMKVNRILLYPYAHLSNTLAKPSVALKVIKEMEKHASELSLETYRTPFGWCKQFSISVKGHPLAEQSMIFLEKDESEEKPHEAISAALKAEEKLNSEWFIMNLDGELISIDQFNFSQYTNLAKFAKYEMVKMRRVIQIPPHVSLMKRLEIADYEPGSDPGNLRFYPKGRLIKSLLEQFVTEKVIEYGGMEVETPIMYDLNHPSLADYLQRFPARQYIINSDDKELFLRFSACFGQFLMTHDAQFSYKQTPYRIYELTRYSFRREKSGELAGLRRLRAFTMPDVHSICADLDQALKEVNVRFKLSLDVLREGLDLDKENYELAIRFTRRFYQENTHFITSFVKSFGKPVLIEIWPKRFFYFTLKWEINFIDNLNKASALSTDQIDVENAERYNITYVDEKGERRTPIILHCSPSGAIERCIYVLLEKAYADQKKGKSPMFPLWLSPTQVRLIPITDKYVQDCENILTKFTGNQIRVDIDNRKMTVQKRIRRGEREWIPYIICIGEREINSETLPVRIRESRDIQHITLQELITEIKRKTKGRPYKPLSLPTYLSKRPVFVG
ncbi:threonine--tRNA ligase [Candidatus Bathyarchaeota archaeon]|nr:MAG: threonine--tRNA ligase [Candidatus Bathyarchaeota archaeon]